MNSAVLPPVKSTIVLLFNAVAALRNAVLRPYFAATSRLAPELATAHAEHLFTLPPRLRRAAAQAPDARRETVTVGRHDLAVWHDGPAGAPAVLLAHGWGGHAAQMAAFVAPLRSAGFRVVWFDQPGHGESGAGRVALPDFERALHALSRTHGPFHGAIGHSLGAAALGLALRHGLALERVVFVAAPASMRAHVRQFARRLGLTPRVREAMRAMVERRYGVAFDEIDRVEELARVAVPALFIHDLRDRQVAFADGLALARLMPRARLLRTHDLGHNRLLASRPVVAACTAFMRAPDAPLPVEIPALPLPAPLY